MSGSASHAGSDLGNAVKKGVGMVHGAGEAIRGNINAAVDSATGDREAAARNEAVASRGADEMDRGYHHTPGTGAGVTPADTDRTRAAPGEYTTGTTGTGAHNATLGNSGLGTR